MLDLVTATNAALNPHFCRTPCTLSPHLNRVVVLGREMEMERNSQRLAVREKKTKRGNNGRLGCLTF